MVIENFSQLLEIVREERHKISFSAVVSNPPYQDSNQSPVFQHFQELSSLLSIKTSMIYLASRWWYGTSGLEQFRTKLLTESGLTKVIYFNEIETREQLFKEIEIAGGVSIVFCDTIKEDEKFILIDGATRDIEDIPKDCKSYPMTPSGVRFARKITSAMDSFNFESVHSKEEIEQNKISLTSDGVKKLNPILSSRNEVVAKGFTKIYANISGEKSGRSEYYMIEGEKSDGLYRVCIGQSIVENENRKLRIMTLDSDTTFGKTLVSIRRFSTKAEAEGFATYCKTAFFEYCLRLSLGSRVKALAAFVPDLATVTNPRTGLIGYASDWTDEDLKILFQDILTPDDWEYIEKTAIESDPVGTKK